MSARNDILAAVYAAKASADIAAARALQGRPTALVQDDVDGSPTKNTIWCIGSAGVVSLLSAEEAFTQQEAGLAGEIYYAKTPEKLAALKRLNGIPA